MLAGKTTRTGSHDANDHLAAYVWTENPERKGPTEHLDVIWRGSLDDWTNVRQSLVNKWGGSVLADRCWDFEIQGGAWPRLWWTTNGLAATGASAESGVAISAADGATTWLRVTMTTKNAAGVYEVKFYQSTQAVDHPDEVTWSQVGSTVTGATATSIHTFDQPIVLGGSFSGVTNVPVGKVRRAVVKDRIGGDWMMDFNAADFSVGDSHGASAVDRFGTVWTLAGDSSAIQETV